MSGVKRGGVSRRNPQMELRGLGLSVFAKDVTENFGPNGSDLAGMKNVRDGQCCGGRIILLILLKRRGL